VPTALAAFTSYGRKAGSARVRVFDWLDHLGLDVPVSDYLGQASNSLRTIARHPASVLRAERTLRLRARAVIGQTALVSRQASPFSNGAVERQILSRAARGVYDFDDALIFTPQRSVEKLWSKRKIWRAAVDAADVVIAGNEYLAGEAEKYSDNVVLIPSCVEPESYQVKSDYALTGSPAAVWLGSPSTEQYLRSIAGPLLAIHESHGLRLTLISAGDATLGALDQMIDRVQWTNESYQQHLALADFGIMPLEDTPWSRGKCAYKLLQYGAAGLPMIGSDVGTNNTVLQRTDGLAVSTAVEWREGIEALIEESATRRAERGANARAAIEEHYSFRAWAESWRGAVGLA
jgi:glycosyltransferase involved in cell wall biosynthesis